MYVTLQFKYEVIVLLFLMVVTTHSLVININSSSALQYYLCTPQGQEIIRVNTTLILDHTIPHYLSTTTVCVLSKVANLNITSSSSAVKGHVKCTHKTPNTGLAIFNSRLIKISNIALSHCGGLIPKEFYHYKQDYFYYSTKQSSTIIFQNCHSVTFTNVCITNYNGFAAVFINTNGSSVLDNICVYHSTALDSCNGTKYDISCTGSGVVIHYYEQPELVANFSLQKSRFIGNFNPGPMNTHLKSEYMLSSMFLKDTLLASSFGAAITVLFSGENGHTNVIISSTFIKISYCLYFGGIAAIYSNASPNSRTILFNTTIHNVNDIGGSYASSHVGFYIHLGKSYPSDIIWTPIIMDEIIVHDHYYDYDGAVCVTDANKFKYSAIYVGIGETNNFLSNYSKFYIDITINKAHYSQVYTGYAYRTPFLDISTHLTDKNNGYQLAKIVKVTFCDCFLETSTPIFASLNLGKMIFTNLRSVTFVGKANHFLNQSGSVIQAINTDIHLKGYQVFSANTANRGAAVRLEKNSYLYVYHYSWTYMVDNRASFTGGAIYSDDTISDNDNDSNLCPIQIVLLNDTLSRGSNNSNNETDVKTLINFVSNSAPLTGNDIYSSDMYHCLQKYINEQQTKFSRNLSLLYDTVFSFPNVSSNGLTSMSSGPVYVKFCKGFNKTTISSVHFGTVMTFGFQVYDRQNKPTYGQVETFLLDRRVHAAHHLHHFSQVGSSNLLSLDQRIQTVYGKGCTTLQYSFTSSIQLTTSVPLHLMFSVVGYTPIIYADISLHPCPCGFELVKGTCNCSTFLRKHDIDQCDITSLAIQVPRHVWIGIKKDYPSLMLYSTYCPNSYCNNKRGPRNLSIVQFDDLCRGHRSGVLCGECKEGYSRVMTFTDCHKCSNESPYIIVIYLIGGVGFVLFLYAFKFTIDSGTIGGLYFCIDFTIKKYMYVKTSDTGRSALMIVSLLMYYIYEPLCITKNMSSLEKAIAAYFAPLYLWSLVGIIIFVSRYSSRVSNLAVGSSVQVLATLMYIAFSDLFAAIISVLTPSHIEGSDGSSMTVWAWDGSVEYIKNIYHLLLVILSCAVLICFVAPFIVCGLFSGALVRRSRCIRYYCRPFLNAFHGPYRVGAQYWFGYRLVLITALKLIIGLEGVNKVQDYFFIVILVVYGVCQAFFQPFVSKFHNAIDLWFTCILILVSLSLLSSLDSHPFVTIFIPYLLLTSAICIVIYHAGITAKRIKMLRNAIHRCTSVCRCYNAAVCGKWLLTGEGNKVAERRQGYESIDSDVPIRETEEGFREPLDVLDI